ncbi:hypothetical protein [Massilia sp. GCM10023247]|uniref:hypothetical protein n=1 Tax=Massilia sp. GCM10023247 TaxID=3252643 RepID=UPI00360E434C
MKVQVTEFAPHGSTIVVAIVESRYTLDGTGEAVLRQVEAHFPTRPVMLVSLEPNGFRAYAPFQTGQLLALLQLESLALREIDLALPPPAKDEPLPF